MSEQITITVHGQPAPQGSKRAFAIRGKGGVPTGRVAVIESSHDRVKSWRQAVIDEVKALNLAGARLAGPLGVTMVFAQDRPKSHYRTGRNAHLLRDSAPVRPVKAPDLSKLVRSTEDALTDAGIWEDDAQVAELTAVKVFTGDSVVAGGLVYGLPFPGAVISVWQVTR